MLAPNFLLIVYYQRVYSKVIPTYSLQTPLSLSGYVRCTPRVSNSIFIVFVFHISFIYYT